MAHKIYTVKQLLERFKFNQSLTINDSWVSEYNNKPEIDMNRRPYIYKMNDYDWWVDFSPEEANKNYRKWLIDSQVYTEQDEFDHDAIELSDNEMTMMQYQLEPGINITFTSRLDDMIESGVEFPCFFASTEC